jgi:hypothetical protein
MMMTDDLNVLILAVLAPALALIGLLGFIIPPHKNPSSGAAPYNVFHIVFGVIGAIIVMSNHPSAIKTFNIGFGMIDIYQAVASYFGIFPQRFFKWTRVDDILHVVIGVVLVVIGVFAQ